MRFAGLQPAQPPWVSCNQHRFPPPKSWSYVHLDCSRRSLNAFTARIGNRSRSRCRPSCRVSSVAPPPPTHADLYRRPDAPQLSLPSSLPDGDRRPVARPPLGRITHVGALPPHKHLGTGGARARARGTRGRAWTADSRRQRAPPLVHGKRGSSGCPRLGLPAAGMDGGALGHQAHASNS